MITSEIININQKCRIISQKGSKKIRIKDQSSVLLEWLLFERRRVIGFASLLHDCLSPLFIQSQVQAKPILPCYL